MKIANKIARSMVEKLEDFEGSNLSAKKVKGIDGKHIYYVVFSYGWYPLLVWDFEGFRWYVNEEKYSLSTSRQLSQCLPEGNLIECTHKEIVEVMKSL